MRFIVKIDCDNDAFHDRPDWEVARILFDVAQRMQQGETAIQLRDRNGNSVGKASFTFDSK